MFTKQEPNNNNNNNNNRISPERPVSPSPHNFHTTLVKEYEILKGHGDNLKIN